MSFDYNVTGSGSFVDNTSDYELSTSTWSVEVGCSDDGERQMRWGMLGLSILIVATASGNILVCLAVSWERRLQNMTNYFLMSLAIADLLVSLLVMPLAMIVEIFGCFPLARSLCVIWATMDVLLCTASIWHMCTMSMDRYFTIRYPIRYGRNRTKKMMTLKITFVWIISFAVSAPLAIAGFVDYNNVYNDGKCQPSIKNFILYGSIFAFYVPLVIMVTTYMLTLRILRQNRVLMSGLQGKYQFQLPVPGDRHRGGHRRSSALSKMDESTRMSCPDLSPQRSSFTITSAAMTSPKGSSGETSTLSPTGERRGLNARGNNKQKPRTPIVKVNLTDEANYVNCNFDPLFLKPTDNGRAHQRRKSSLAVKLKSLSPKHSRARAALRRGSQPNASRSRIDPTDSWNPSLLLFRITRYYSDSELTRLQSDYSRRSFDGCCYSDDDQRPNGVGRFIDQDQMMTRNGTTALPPFDNNYYVPLTDRRHMPTSPISIRGHDLESSFICFDETELLKREGSTCLTAQTTMTEVSRGPSPFSVDDSPAPSVIGGRYMDTLQLAKQRNGGRGLLQEALTNRNGFQELNFDGLSAKQKRSNGTAKKKGQRKEERLDELRGFLMTPTRRQFPPQRPSAIGMWDRFGGRSPSVNTSPSSSESRSVMRSRLNVGRSTQRQNPSACARKIGLLTKNRTNNERKASKVLGIIFGVFVLSWTPFFTMNIISVLCDHCMDSITDSIVASMVWLGYLSSLANPIIYTMFSTSFRTVFYRILTCQYSHKTVGSCGGHASSSRQLQTSEERFLCWTKSGRKSSIKDFAGESKSNGV